MPKAQSPSRQLDLSRKADAHGEGAVTVKLALSSAEAGALKVMAAQDGRIQVSVDPLTGAVTVSGDAALVLAALRNVQLEVTPGFAKTFKMDIAISQGGEERHEQVILYFERASGHHVPLDSTGGGSSFVMQEAERSAAQPRLAGDDLTPAAGSRSQGDHTRAMPTAGEEEGNETPTTILFSLPPVEYRQGYIPPVIPSAVSVSPPNSVPESPPPAAPVTPIEPAPPVSSTPLPPTPPSGGSGGGGGGGGAAIPPALSGTSLTDHMRLAATGAGAYSLNAASAFTGYPISYSMSTRVYGTGDPALWTSAGFLTINAVTGEITNTAPLTAGTVLVTVTASFGGNSVSESYEMYIPTAGVLQGTTSNDNLFPAGTAGVDQLWGDDLNDTLNGLAGGTTVTPEVIHAGEGNDSVNDTGADANLIFGGSGNDTLRTTGNNGTLHGGDGDDSIYAGGVYNYVSGGNGNDSLSGASIYLTIYGGDGDDSMIGTGQGDTFYGDNGNDTLQGVTNSDMLYGGAGNDSLNGGTGFDRLYGGNDNDILDGGTDVDNLYGEVGADTLTGGAGGDAFRYTAVSDSTPLATDIINDFAYGQDILSFAGAGFAGITDMVAGAPTPTALGYTFDGTYTVLTNLAGTFALKLLGNYTLNSGSLMVNNVINGVNGGDDTITSTWNVSGTDTVRGYDGNDSLMGVTGLGSSCNFFGGNGNDTIVANGSNYNYNYFYGEDGNDSINFSGTSWSRGYGGNGDDTILGSTGYANFYGNAGADSLISASGFDCFEYSALTDSTSLAEDTITGFQSGRDLIRMNGMGLTSIAPGAPAGTVLGYVFDGTYTVITDASATLSLKLLGNYALTSANFSFNNVITGTGAGETIVGTLDSDTIYGMGGADSIDGSNWFDVIYGGDGDDTITGLFGAQLYGGNGVDRLVATSAGDRFWFTATTDSGIGLGNRDVIVNINQAGGDRIDVSTFAGVALFQAAGNGIADLTGGAFQVAWQQQAGNTIVFVDTDGNNATDFEIQLNGLYALTAGYFTL